MMNHPSLPGLVRRMIGSKQPEQTASDILKRTQDHNPDFTAIACFKAGPLGPALFMPIGPSCPLHTLEEAVGATVQGDRRLVGYWIRV